MKTQMSEDYSMNYEDELERARAKRSRKRQSNTGIHSSTGTRSSNGVRSTSGSGNVGTHGSAGAHSRMHHAADDGLDILTNHAAARTSRSSQSGTYRRRKKNKTKRIVIGVVLAIVLIAAVAGIGVFAYFNYHLGKSQGLIEFDASGVQNENIPLEIREKMQKGFWTVAVFGVDSRDNSLGKGNQSDVIMIANLNRNTGEIKLVSVYRDTYLNINDRNTYNKINAAYASGGPEAAVKALNKNLDLNITHYATFNWKAVATVINILGGVDIEISPSEFYYINAFITETVKGTGIGSTQLDGPGLKHLDGVQAVAYGRLRLMDSDYARTERQRIVIQKAFDKVKTADLSTLNDVVGHVFSMCATNIEFGDLAGLVKDVAKFHMGETSGFPAARGEARIKIGSDKLSCVVPQTLESNVISLHNFLYGDENYTPSAMVREISAKIASVSGLSTEAEEIGHVATDKGYVPKKTTEAAAETADNEPDETEAASEGESEETSEGETLEGETLEGESGEADESSAAEEGESEEDDNNSIFPFNPFRPGNNDGPANQRPTASTEDEGPKSPADMTTAAPQQNGGPGGPGSVPTEPTTSSGPGGKPQTGLTPSTPKPTEPSPAESSAPSSGPATSTPVEISPGSTLGPASQTTAAAQP